MKSKPKTKKTVRKKPAAKKSPARKAVSKKLDALLDRELEGTFPASDPLELTEPGSTRNFVGAPKKKKKKKKRKS